MRRLLRSVWLLFVLVGALSAQVYPLRLIGLNDDRFGVTGFIEDPTGLLWITTKNGLFRYNGRALQALAETQNQDFALPVRDSQGNIWAVSSAGVWLIQNGVIRSVAGNAYSAVTTTGTKLILVPEEKYLDENPFQAVDIAEVLKMGRWNPVPAAYRGHGHFNIARDGHAFFACGFGVCETRDFNQPGAITAYGAESGLPKDHWNTVALDGAGAVWARSNQSLYVRKPGRDLFVPAGPPISGGDGLEVDPLTGLWAGGSSGLLNSGKHGIRFISSDRFSFFSTINATLHATDGTLWFGLPNGPARVAGDMAFAVWGKDQGVNAPVVTILRGSDGNMYIGTLHGGCMIRETNCVPIRGLETIGVVSFVETPDRRILAVDRTKRVFELKVAGAALVSPNVYHSLGFSRTRVGESQVGLIWLPRTPLPEKVQFPSDPGRVRSTAMDSGGNVWFCANTGIFVRSAQSAWRQITSVDGMLESACQAIGIDFEGAVWIGYDHPVGYSKLSAPGKNLVAGPLSFRHYKTPARYDYSTFFFGIDNGGRVWRGAGGGVDVSDGIHVAESDWIHLDKGDGLAGNDAGPNAFFNDRDGSVWLGSDEGVTKIRNPAALFEKRNLKVTLIRTNEKILIAVSPNASASRATVQYRLLRAQDDGRAVPWTTASSLEVDIAGVASDRYRLESRIVPTEWVHGESTSLEFTIGGAISRLWYLTLLVIPVALSVYGLRLRRKSRYVLLRRIFEEVSGLSPEKRAARLSELPHDARNELHRILRESAADSRAGQIFGERFLIEHRIGHGGSGDVWLARDLTMGRRPVALKTIHCNTDANLARWQTEIASLERLRHPGIVRLIAGAVEEGEPYLVTEYIEGITLRSILQRGIPPLSWTHRIIDEILDALEYAHSQRVLHCDLKPDNVMIRNRGGEGESPVLIDFGAAMLKQHDGSVTLAPHAAGALDYMAPEQLSGRASEAADVFAVASILFELITGLRWRQTDANGDWAEHLRDHPAISAVPQRALEPNPRERLRTVQSFRFEYHSARGGSTEPRSQPCDSPAAPL